jgi:beta-lactamase class C
MDARMSRTLAALSLLLAVASPCWAYDDAQINAAAKEFMQSAKAPGLAIGIVTPAGPHVLFYGLASRETAAKVDEHTLFEIGSTSKTFTAILAAYAVETGAMRWEDAPSKYVPELRGTHLDQVSLLNLATHTTGGMPQELSPDAKRNADRMFDFFRHWVPAAAPGTTRSYANPSIGLLGAVTAHALGGKFSELMRDTLFKPIGMTHTFYDVPAEEQKNYAEGYTSAAQPVRMPALEGFPLAAEAFGVRTTAGDLLRFVEANLGAVGLEPTVRRALSDATTGYFEAGPMTQALIWEWYPLPVSSKDFEIGNSAEMINDATAVTRLDPPRPAPSSSLINKQGATPGFGSYVAFIPGRHVGLALLTNRGDPHVELLALAKRLFAILGVSGVADNP